MRSFTYTRTCVHPHTRKTDPVAHAIICTNTAAWNSDARRHTHTDAVNSLNSVNYLNWGNFLITLITRTHAIIYIHTRTCVHPHTRKTDPVAHAIICTNTAAWNSDARRHTQTRTDGRRQTDAHRRTQTHRRRQTHRRTDAQTQTDANRRAQLSHLRH